MSIISGVRTAAEFNTYVSDVDTYLNSPEYAAAQAAQASAQQTACCGHVSRQIKNFLNRDSMDGSITSPFIIYVGGVNPTHITQITTDLTDLGYTVNVDENQRMFISW